MQKRTVKDMEFDYNIAKEQLAIKEKLIQVDSWDVNIFFLERGRVILLISHISLRKNINQLDKKSTYFKRLDSHQSSHQIFLKL